MYRIDGIQRMMDRLAPARTLFICTTPRSGSTLLCDLVAATGALGKPASYFRRQSLKNWTRRLGLGDHETDETGSFTQSYLNAVLRHAQTSNGTAAERLMYDHFDVLINGLRRLNTVDSIHLSNEGDVALIERVFGPSHFVFLSREDKVAQAVSRVRAEQSGRWHEAADGGVREQIGSYRQPRYDADRIGRYVAEQIADEQNWRDWFQSNHLSPLELTYEALSADPQREVARLLRMMGEDMGLAEHSVAQTRKLADAESDEWIARFKRNQTT